SQDRERSRIDVANDLAETRSALRRRSRFDEGGWEDMSHQNLEEKLQAVGSAVEMTRNSQIGPYVYPAVPGEFSNWRDEQISWARTSALFDKPPHMLDLQIEGPDTIGIVPDLGVNSFENFGVNKAKQLVVCNHDGYVIGDGILFHLDENRVRLVGGQWAP